MPLVTLVVVLALAIHYVEGYQRIVYVSELAGSDNIFTSGESEGGILHNNEDNDSLNCCVYGNCSCSSLDHALAHLTNNTVINITTSITLSSSIKLSNLQNVLIIGQNNSTVNCKNVEEIHLTLCHNCIIQGITWNGCGSESTKSSGLKLSYSSNITIQNCSFHHSIGQAVVLLIVSGVINIKNCQFTHNNHYRGHGSAIHYSLNNVTHSSSQLSLTIENCNFIYNKGAKSLVYIENKNSKQESNITFYYSKFCHNEGTSIYVVNQKLSLRGKFLFQNNTAKNGTGIYISDYSTVIIDNNSNVAFIQNSAHYMGGAVFLRNHSVIRFDQNSEIRFNNNHVSIGTIYSEDRSNVIFAANCKVTFHSNSATQCGTAIGSFDNSNITFTGNSKVEFINNIVHELDGHHSSLPHGGTIYTQNCGHVSFDGNSSTLFSKNTAEVGGAIYSFSHCHLSFEGNSSTVFSDNTAKGGGALFSTNNVYISFEGSCFTKFTNNRAVNGGAITSYKNSHICFEDNSFTLFSKNSAENNGGAIVSKPNGHICFEDNAVAEFSSNTANKGGAISLYKNSHIYFKNVSSTLFINNNANFSGGAIISRDNGSVCFEGNSSTTFSNNIAEFGGAIFSRRCSTISFEDSSFTVFSSNVAKTGGAIHTNYSSNIYFDMSSITLFNNNTAGFGGAINSADHSLICFKENSSTEFNDNTAYGNGGAIRSRRSSHISFKDNSSTLFSFNAAESGGAVWCYLDSNISFEVNSFTLFSNNIADYNGGAIKSRQRGYISFEGNSFAKFSNNIADYGGALLVEQNSNIAFSNNSKVRFSKNKATFDTTVYSYDNSTIIVRENSAIMFNDLPAKWCNDTCLPYAGDQNDVAALDSSGMVWCNNQEAFIYLNKICYCKRLESLLDDMKSNVTVNITDEVMTLSTLIKLKVVNSLITAQNNVDIICVNGGRLLLSNFHNLTIQGITWFGCGSNSNFFSIPVILIKDSCSIKKECRITIQNCSFQHSLAPAIGFSASTQNVDIAINHCKFMNTKHKGGHGAAVHSLSDNGELIRKFTITNCIFNYNGVAKSLIYIMQRFPGSKRFIQVHINDSKFYNNQGVPIHVSNHINLTINGNILFENNVAQNGAGMYISGHSTIMFDKNSKVKFNNNTAINGSIYSEANSNVTFKENCEVMFNNNSAKQYGAAIYAFDNSHIAFTGNSKVTFSNNDISSSGAYHQFGGTIFSKTFSSVIFDENCTTQFYNNIANFGAAIFSFYNSKVIFKGKSRVMFNNNIAHSCGTLTSLLFSTVIFHGSTEVSYINNTVLCTSSRNFESSAGAICSFKSTEIIFSENSLITFINNRADKGGAMAFSESNVIIQKHSTVKFYKNAALYSYGGAFECSNNSSITIKGYSNVTFSSNSASENGGAIYLHKICNITFTENSISNFVNNNARNDGGAIANHQHSEITFTGNAIVNFNHNIADNGGTFYFTDSIVTFKESSMVSFYNNKAIQSGGAGYFGLTSKVILEGNTTVRFHNNRGINGGAILGSEHSSITLTGSSVISFVSNEAAQSGGGGYFYSHCNFLVNENAQLKFRSNKALDGGGVYITGRVKLIFKESSTFLLSDNLATVGGGAIKVSNDSNVTLMNYNVINFTNNSAQYGAAIFLDITAIIINNDKKLINFNKNLAKITGNSVYQDVQEHCNSTCLNNKILGINNGLIATPPNILNFYDPAKCIDADSDTQCNSYYVPRIMLGREIVIPACVLDYYNHTVDLTQFLISDEKHPHYFITGPKQILIGCNTFKGISVMGNTILSKSVNFSITIMLNVDHDANWKQISVTLFVELSPCHPGFWQYPESQKCECYNANDIVFCSGGNSTIKTGYWFGSVTGKPTITFCPVNYCNFTCCEASNGYYHLSPLRDNQCRSHRSGISCGSCAHGYTLSFDSTECVNAESCTTGQAVLVILLTIIYWIVMIALVFAVMYYKVGIGYLYSITYYYSIVDIIVSETLLNSRGLHFIVNVISSFSKITPQFLGKFCLITGISGIDQQFIHYIHPSAIILILLVISLLARRSPRVSEIISRGIIHVLCVLLLLSYTSVASTSLLLIRSLRFHEIDEIYTYLSPDIEYFRGRHSAYGTVALLCTVTIVIGLPLLLTLEPFLNCRINFVKIKPLLDQFQGCYKDNYRCFAGYYMICRLLVISVIIANSSNTFSANYILIAASATITLIHVLVKPYNHEILNKFDSVVLHLIILVTALPLFDDFDSPVVIAMIFIVISLPLLTLTGMTLFLHKNNLKLIVRSFLFKDISPRTTNNNEINDNKETSLKEFYFIIDDSARVNATICDVNEPNAGSNSYRESFIEAMNDIQDIP